MATMAVHFRATQTRHVGFSVVDALARAFRASGEFPAPLGRIECRIVAQVSPVAQAFDPPRTLRTALHRGSFMSMDGTWWISPSSSPRPLGPGVYRAEVVGEYYRPYSFTFTWPLGANDQRLPVDPANPPGTAALLPSVRYPVPDATTSRNQLSPTILRGTLFEENGEPTSGVGVAAINLLILNPPELPALGAWPFFDTVTDAAGDWMIVLPGRRYIDAAPEALPVVNPPAPPLTRNMTVRVTPPLGVATDVVVPVQYAAENSLRNTMIRGLVTDASGGPLADVQITTNLNLRRSRTGRDGAWRLCFAFSQGDVPGITITATRPDGSTASVAGVPVRRGATVVAPTILFP